MLWFQRLVCCTLPDVVLGCEDELIVENPLRFVVKAGAGVELDNLGEEEVLLLRLTLWTKTDKYIDFRISGYLVVLHCQVMSCPL